MEVTYGMGEKSALGPAHWPHRPHRCNRRGKAQAAGEDAGSGSGSKEDGEIPIPNMLTKAKKGDIMK